MEYNTCLTRQRYSTFSYAAFVYLYEDVLLFYLAYLMDLIGLIKRLMANS